MPTKKRPKKNKAAVSLGKLGGTARAKNLSPERLSEIGRLGGKAGGAARAAALTPEQRKEIARKAIAARWAKKEK
jgi:general stress protein YciG